MNIGIFSVIELLLIGLGFLCKVEKSAIIMACLTMFVAATAINAGGLTVNPAVLFVPFYACMAFFKASRDQNYTAPLIGKGGFWLVLFIVYAMVVTLLTPRFFAGEIEIMWPSGDANSAPSTLLKPGNGNFTQTGYMLVAAVCYFMTYRIFKARHSARAVLNLILWVAAVNALFSLLDNLSYYTHTNALLNAVIRNGSYNMLDSDTVGGLKRTVGTFTEASFYGCYTLAIAACLLALHRQHVRHRMVVPLLLVTMAFLCLSLSSTAYVGTVLYILRLLLPHLISLLQLRRIPRAAFIAICGLLVAGGGIAVAYMAMGGIQLLDDLIFHKAESQSGMERLRLNTIAWGAFLDSYGLGVGIGSTRAASFVLVLLSNVGVVGALLFTRFVTASFTPRAPMHLSAETRSLLIACREGVFAYLIGAALCNPVFDLGLLVYVLAGAGSALAYTTAAAPVPRLGERIPRGR